MKVMICGASGQLGCALQRTRPANVELILHDLDLDIRSEEQVLAGVEASQPAVIINAAAYTAVDRAEQDLDTARAVNALGAGNLAQAAKAVKARLVHVSTDFVFSGTASEPYPVDAAPAPLSVYGMTKLEGEQAVESSGADALILRTAWLYSADGSNFVKSMLRFMSERDELRIIDDQIGTPTTATTLAKAIWSLLDRQAASGTYHCTDAGVASWYDFAVAIQEEALVCGLLARRCVITPIPTSGYPTPARRPHYSVLDKSALWSVLGEPARHWRVGLREVLANIKAGEQQS